MEICIDQVEGLPAHTYLSVRYGDLRKLTAFKAGEVVNFGKVTGADQKAPKSYTVDVFRKVGSKQVSLAGITALGGTVRSEGLVIPSLEIQGSPVRADLTAKLVEEPAPAGAAAEAGARREQVAALKAKNYLERHRVQHILHEMFAQLLELQPADPLGFMIEHLEQQKEGEEQDEMYDFASEPGLGPAVLPGFADGTGPEDLPNLAHHHSIMADVFRKDAGVYERLHGLKTALGVSVAQCIKPGIDCPGHELVKVAGAFAGDEESYTLYQDLFNPIISALHSGWAPHSVHVCEADPAKLPDTRIDPPGRYAVYASMEVRRNFSGIRLPTTCSLEERRQVEHLLISSAASLGGAYLPLRQSTSHAAKPGGMLASQEERLRTVGMLFTEPDSRMRLSAGLGRDWPDARGVYLNEAQGLYLWCNEEDHLRFFARQHAVDLKRMWTTLHKTVQAVGQGAEKAGHGFSRSDHLGYTTTCPSRLGAALRISVCLKIPLLAATTDLQALCRSLGVQSSQEMENPTYGSVWNITSPDCLGTSELGLIEGMIRGCATLVTLEGRLENGEPIYDVMPGLGDQALAGFPADDCPETLPSLANSFCALAAVLREQPGLYAKLRGLRTPSGVGLAPLVKPGIDARGQPGAAESAGLVAGDEASFETFRELFDPVLARLHKSFAPSSPHPSDASLARLGEAAKAGAFARHCASVRVELRRNLGGLRLAPCVSRQERQEVERLLGKAMMAAGERFPAEYFPLACSESYAPRPGGTDWAKQAELCNEGLLFTEPTSTAQLAAGVGRHWPDARGAFVAGGGQLAVWCNQEDHVRVLSWDAGADLAAAFAKAKDCAEALGASFEAEGKGYMRSERLGFLTVDPAFLGAGLAAAAVMRLPRLSARPDFVAICQALRLQASWCGSHWEVASRPGLGVSEGDLLCELQEGCARLSALEGQLEEGRSIEGELRLDLGERP